MPAEPTFDHLGHRRLSTTETVGWYAFATLTYIGFGVFHKWLLNWIIGPVWLVAMVWVLPPLVDRLRGVPTRGEPSPMPSPPPANESA